MDLKKIKVKILEFYNKRKKLVLIGGTLLVLIIAAAIFMPSPSSAEDQETSVQYVAVSRGALTESIDVVGTLEARPMVELAWESGGIVKPFDLKTGDSVSKDDELLVLEESSLSSSILQAQSSLLDAQAALDNLLSANSDLYTASQTLADAEYELRQYKADRDSWNVIGSSWDDIDDARSAYYAAQQVVWEKDAAYETLRELDVKDPKRVAVYDDYKAAVAVNDKALRVLNNLLGTYYDHSLETDLIEYDQAKAAVEVARVDYTRYLDQSDEIAAAQAEVQALQNTIDQARIMAPFAGTVTEISAVAGEKVASGDTAVRIDNLDNLIVQVAVSEVDINKVSLGQKAVLTFDALKDKEYEGEVSAISSSGTDNSGVVEFNVNVKVHNADAGVKPGFTSVVSIITSQVEDALLVPNDAVISRNGQTAVILVAANGSTSVVPVETGTSSDTFTQIISGEIVEGSQLAVYSSSSGSLNGMPPIMGGEMRVITGGGQGPSGNRPPQN